MPATFTRLSITSFGHLIWTARSSSRSSASATATPATSESSAAFRSAGGLSSTENSNAVPGGASQVRPSRPRPPVWKSATAIAPSAIDASRSACVDSQESTSIRGSPSFTWTDRYAFDPGTVP